MLGQAGERSLVAVGGVIAGLFAQAAEIPGSAFLTASAGIIGIVAIGQMVRAISKTESQKTEVIEVLRKELSAAHDEIRSMYEVLRKFAEDEAAEMKKKDE
jgi:esterase/lipase